MSDIESLLHVAADDSDRHLYTSVEDILKRGRRSVRNRRIAGIATAALTATAVAVGAAPTISAFSGVEPSNPSQVAVAGSDAAEKKVVPAPPVSPLKDAEILRRCLPGDKETLDFNKTYKYNTYDKAGPLNAKWSLALKSGVGKAFMAVFVSPDRSVAAVCYSGGLNFQMKGVGTVWRPGTTNVIHKGNPEKLPMTQSAGLQAPDNVARVLFEVAGEKLPREALLSKTGGFYTIGWPTQDESKLPVKVKVRGYDAKGKLVFNLDTYQQGQRIPPLVK